jgi:hypothetical protein
MTMKNLVALPTFLALFLTLAASGLYAQADDRSRLSGLDARLGALAAESRSARLVTGSLVTATGVIGGSLLAGFAQDPALPLQISENQAIILGVSTVVSGALIGGFTLGLPTPAERYWKDYEGLPEGFAEENRAKIAAGEAFLDALAMRARGTRRGAAVLAFAISTWGFASTGYLDGLIPGLSGQISPWSSFAKPTTLALTQGIGFLSCGLVFAILPTAAESARESYLSHNGFSLSGFDPWFSLGPTGPTLGVHIEL